MSDLKSNKMKRKIKRYILALLLCLAYKSVRIVQQAPEVLAAPEPIHEGIIHFCKDLIKAIDPKGFLRDVGDNPNDIVDF